MRRRTAVLLIAATAAAAGCGSSSGPSSPPSDAPARAGGAAPTPSPPPSSPPRRRSRPARPADERLLRRWAAANTRNDSAAAARFFSRPTVVQQGPVPYELTELAQIRLFNEGLSCGAVLTGTRREPGGVIGTFRMRTRPGHHCRDIGELVAVAFVIRDGRIRVWRQLPDLGEPAAPRTSAPEV